MDPAARFARLFEQCLDHQKLNKEDEYRNPANDQNHRKLQR